MKNDFYQSRHIHPNTPRRLVTALHKAGWNRRELARVQKVNSYYVTSLLNEGIEPSDKTKEGQRVRVQLFLPRLKPKPRADREPLPEWLLRIRKKIAVMAKETRHSLGLQKAENKQ